MNLRLQVLLAFALAMPLLALGQEITVSATEKPGHYKNVKGREDISVLGELRTVPMRGATWVLMSYNLGQITLFKSAAIPDAAESQLLSLQKRNVTVRVTGSLLMLCTERELRQENVVGCREFDNTKDIKIAVR